MEPFGVCATRLQDVNGPRQITRLLFSLIKHWRRKTILAFLPITSSAPPIGSRRILENHSWKNSERRVSSGRLRFRVCALKMKHRGTEYWRNLRFAISTHDRA